MSLINQVLRDLDRRHASPAAMPSTVKPLRNDSGRSRRWRQLGLGIVAMAAVGGAAGMAAWSFGVRPVPAAGVSTAAVVAAPVTPPTVSTPVVVVASPVVAPASAPASASASALPVPAPVAITEPGESPAASIVPAPRVAAIPAAPPSPAPVAEPRIEKRAPSRTAHERAEADYQRGVAAHQQQSLVEAAAAYESALREEPGLAVARQALAALLAGQGRGNEARDLLTQGLQRHPQHAAMALMLARLHAERGELQRAADVLQPIPVLGASAEDLAFRAAILQRLERHADAAEHFAAALRTTPSNGVWWMGLGMSLAADGRNDVAREAFNRARGSGTLSPELAQYVEQRLRQLL